eukprot:gene36771-37817_t
MVQGRGVLPCRPAALCESVRTSAHSSTTAQLGSAVCCALPASLSFPGADCVHVLLHFAGAAWSIWVHTTESHYFYFWYIFFLCAFPAAGLEVCIFARTLYSRKIAW